MSSQSVLIAMVVAIDQISPDPEQPRTEIDRSELEMLAASIRGAGIIQPLLVSAHPDPEARQVTPYMIVAGERRWRAARLAGLAAVPVVVHPGELSAADRLMLQLDENDGELRRELSLYDRAAAVARALSLSGQKKDEFARRHQKSSGWVSHYVAIAGATGPTRDALASGFLTGITVTRLFARLSATEQRRLLQHAKRTQTPITAARIEGLAQRSDHSTRRAEAGGPGASGTGGAVSVASEDGSATQRADAAAETPREDAEGAATEKTAGPAAGSSFRRPSRFTLAADDLAALLRLLGHSPRGTSQEQFQLLLALARAPCGTAAAGASGLA
jgi:ParB family chromosome partitioning protein